MSARETAQETRLFARLIDTATGELSAENLGAYLIDEVWEVFPSCATAATADRAAHRAAPPKTEELAAAPRTEAAATGGAVEAEVEYVPSRAERRKAAADFRRLEELRGAARLEAVRRSSRRMKSPLLVEKLLAEARDLLPYDPHEALALQEAAALVVARVSPVAYGPARQQRLVARVEAHRANTLRVLGELPAADAIWRSIHARLGGDTTAPPAAEEAELLSLEGSLRTSLRQFTEAERLLRGAQSLYAKTRDDRGVAKTLLQRGSCANYAGDSTSAVARFQEAAALLDPVADADLYLMSQHNLANNLVQLGRPGEAKAVMAANRALYAAHDDPVNRMRRRWVEGKIARAEERWDDARRGLEETRTLCLAQSMAYDVALVSIDLADLFLATGRTAEVERLAGEIGPLFASRGVHREALAALVLFRQAAADQRLTAEFLARLRRYLVLARSDPRLRFRDVAAGGPDGAGAGA